MQRLLLMTAGAALILFTVSCSGGNSPPNPSTTPTVSAAAEDTTKVITDFENEWVAAIVKKDTDTINRLLADDFSGTKDQIYFKGDAIEDVKSGTHESLDLDNIKVRLFGDTAVVTMGQNEKSRHGNTDFTGHYLFTDVWAKKNGQWFAVASHGSRVR